MTGTKQITDSDASVALRVLDIIATTRFQHLYASIPDARERAAALTAAANRYEAMRQDVITARAPT
jgi:hypothetical protein